MEPAFQIAEEHCDGLDPFLVGQILDAFLANLINRHAIHAVRFGFQIQRFELFIRKRKKIAKFSRHSTPGYSESEYRSKFIIVGRTGIPAAKWAWNCAKHTSFPTLA